MKWSYRIARVAGIDIKIHVTFPLLLAWFAFQSSSVADAMVNVGFMLLLFLCVLLHEFGHAFAARAFGIPTPDITLTPIGGIARLERMPEKPWQELVVAIAGPMVNVVILVVLFFVMAAKFTMASLAGIDVFDSSILGGLFYMNKMLILFNAIPAIPMDGGRVLRSLLAMKFDYVKATTIAAKIGQGIAVYFAACTLLPTLVPHPAFLGGPFLLFIAMVVFSGAQQELAYAKWRAGLYTYRPPGSL